MFFRQQKLQVRLISQIITVITFMLRYIIFLKSVIRQMISELSFHDSTFTLTPVTALLHIAVIMFSFCKTDAASAAEFR